MFSGLLLPTTLLKTGTKDDTIPLVAQTTDLNVEVVSGSGQGSVDLTYLLDKEYGDLVFYVPYLIAHQGKTRQCVKLTHCQLFVTNTNSGKEEVCTLKLSRLIMTEYCKCADSLPSCAELKKQYKDLVSKYAGAHSGEDVLLHLGNQSASSVLTIHIEFLVKFDCPSALHPVFSELTPSLTPVPSSQWQYVIHSILPTKQLNYSFTIVSPLQIERVAVPPLVQKKLQWKYIGENELTNAVHVVCAFESGTQHPYTCSYDFSIVFAPGTLSGCFTCVPSIFTSGTQQNDSLLQLTKQQNWDAIMMLDFTLSRNQLPFAIQHHRVYPSEFLFVIDCSGSMGGSNIQSATDMLVTCVKSLPNECYFNVIAFGSRFRQLFHASDKYSKHTTERAVVFANQLQATLGGTDLLPPLQWIFKKPSCAGLPRQVFIITDGGVTNTQQVLNIVKQNRHYAR